MAEFDATYGRTFIGLIVAAILYGVAVLQTFLYFKNYPRDGLLIKLMVVVIVMLDTAQLVLSSASMYWYLITNIKNPGALSQVSWSMNVQTDCNGLIGLIVELFFARRVWIMCRNPLLTGIIVLLSFVHFALGIVFTIGSFQLQSINEYSKLTWVTSAGLGSAAAADLLIAASLVYYLTKSRTGMHRTDSLINVLTIYSLTTGLATGLLACIVVLIFAIKPHDYMWEAFFWVLGKVYVNSLLATLNSREYLREKVAPTNSFVQLSGLPQLAGTSITEPTFSTSAIASLNMPPQRLRVAVQSNTVSKTDYLSESSPATEVSMSTNALFP